METSTTRTALIASVAPLAWGTTYYVTEEFLPPDRPLFAALVRALPAGLLLLAVQRTLPRGDWWWRAAVLGICNIGAFFPLIFLSAYHLPGGLAATVQATSPLAVMALAFLLIGERATTARLAGALTGLTGVMLLVLQSPDGVTALGLIGAFGSVAVSGLGFVLVKRWPVEVPMLTLVSWQLVVGGLVLLPVALIVEGAPPKIDAAALGGYIWIGVMGTILAYTCWFYGLRNLPAGAVSLLGLLNPVMGTVLGVALVGETFGWWQALGMGLVLSGVLLGQRQTRRRRAEAAPPPPVVR
ncbi:DMT family transporter [Nocardioides sp. R-C-SC26]|uniref:DMT family transporter n=1 Tax=Nocardioides sp. R-C-SC26 TaxID=2870414 RepID=UPI001E533896|nr:EamA family transporter [Nocardioides sp. R-C-SC26]